MDMLPRINSPFTASTPSTPSTARASSPTTAGERARYEQAATRVLEQAEWVRECSGTDSDIEWVRVDSAVVRSTPGGLELAIKARPLDAGAPDYGAIPLERLLAGFGPLNGVNYKLT